MSETLSAQMYESDTPACSWADEVAALEVELEGLRTRIAGLNARCGGPDIDILIEDYIDNTVAWMYQYKEQRDKARAALAAADSTLSALLQQ